MWLLDPENSSSTTFSHGEDSNRIIELPEFEIFTKFKRCVKPVFVTVVDGGPDENPRYKNVIKMKIYHFIEFNLDALFIVCNAHGGRAYNRVERRMAPLSKELSGLISPHDHHWNSQRSIIDDELVKKKI